MPRRMSYSPATAAMQRMVAAHAESGRTGVPVDELLDQGGSERQRSAALRRRTFLTGAVASAGLIAMPSAAQADTRAPAWPSSAAGSPAPDRACAVDRAPDPLDHLRGRHEPYRRAVLEPARILLRRPDRRARRCLHQLRSAADPAPGQETRPEGGGREWWRPAPRPGDLLDRRRPVHRRGSPTRLGHHRIPCFPHSGELGALPAAVGPEHARGASTRPPQHPGVAR